MKFFLLAYLILAISGCSSKVNKNTRSNEVFLSSAEEFLNKNDYLQYFKHISFYLMNEAPFDINNRLRAAQIFEKIGDKKKALVFYNEVLKLDSQNYNAFLGKSRSVSTTEESLSVLNHFLSIQPDSVEALLMRAVIFEEKKSWLFAQDDYEKVLAKDKKNISSLYGMVRVYQAQEKYTEAYDVVGEILQQSSKETTAYILRLDLLQRLGKVIEAQIAFNEFINKFPNNLAVRFSYGEFLLNKDQINEAKDQFEFIKKLDHFHPMTNFYLGKIYIDQGQVGKAGIIFKELYENNTGEEWIAKSYSRILAYVGQEEKSIKVASSISAEKYLGSSEIASGNSKSSTAERVVAATSPSDYISVKIKRGDTLQSLSKKFYGTTKFWKMLLSLNKLKSGKHLKMGLKIKIPNRAE